MEGVRRNRFIIVCSALALKHCTGQMCSLLYSRVGRIEAHNYDDGGHDDNHSGDEPRATKEKKSCTQIKLVPGKLNYWHTGTVTVLVPLQLPE